ncbi:hypothetical protein [Microbulbifer harenosus]|uniref:hypothetical protein n=1 Tax=Microbulbifer harenosus TaxID=2576840 RepID=UPI001C70995B|nr:hypothetical protein [Microbulbifer harenosus]
MARFDQDGILMKLIVGWVYLSGVGHGVQHPFQRVHRSEPYRGDLFPDSSVSIEAGITGSGRQFS